MKAPATPENETDRLNSLRESGLLEIDSSPAFDRLTRLAKRFFQVPLAMVNLIDEHSLIVKSADGKAPDTVPRNISFCGHTILTEAPLVVGDMLQDDRFADNPLVAGEPRVRFYAGFPLRLRDGASDELTGLFNRRGFNQLVRFTLSVARRRAEPLTLGWLDLDRFKEINDRYGHEEGDKALKVMAQLMRSAFREADMLVRFGGDEFAVLFADTDEQGAWIAMQYLAEQVESYNARKLHPWSLHFSWGLSEFDHNGNDLQQWLKDADEKMYAMKQQRQRAR